MTRDPPSKVLEKVVNKVDKHYQLIETQARMDAFARDLNKEKMIAVDLEADSMYHFSEKVCLVQISTTHGTHIVDPLRPLSLGGLAPVFKDPEIKKVFHGADYDIRSLYRDFSFEVNHLFDTHLASRFLGLKETSLEAVLHHHFGVTLDKRFQKKDWSKRPLPEEMIDYAAQDSAYLLPLAKTLIKELKNLNRLYWVEEECALLSQVRPNQTNHQPLYLHFKGAGTLAPKELAVLEALLQLRKKNAMQRDKPLFKIFQNPCIVKIVKSKPVTLHQLKKINAFSGTQMEIYGEDVVDAVIQALKIPASDLPLWPRRKSRPLRGATQTRIKNLKEWKDKKAEALRIDPSLVLNRALITAISEKKPGDMETLSRIDNIKQWQIKEFGEEILNVLQDKGGYGTKHNISGG